MMAPPRPGRRAAISGRLGNASSGFGRGCRSVAVLRLQIEVPEFVDCSHALFGSAHVSGFSMPASSIFEPRIRFGRIKSSRLARRWHFVFTIPDTEGGR